MCFECLQGTACQRAPHTQVKGTINEWQLVKGNKIKGNYVDPDGGGSDSWTTTSIVAVETQNSIYQLGTPKS